MYLSKRSLFFPMINLLQNPRARHCVDYDYTQEPMHFLVVHHCLIWSKQIEHFSLNFFFLSAHLLLTRSNLKRTSQCTYLVQSCFVQSARRLSFKPISFVRLCFSFVLSYFHFSARRSIFSFNFYYLDRICQTPQAHAAF